MSRYLMAYDSRNTIPCAAAKYKASCSSPPDWRYLRAMTQDKHIREELRRLLPRDEGRATEKPAEAAFRQRMWVLAMGSSRSRWGFGTGGFAVWLMAACGLVMAVQVVLVFQGAQGSKGAGGGGGRGGGCGGTDPLPRRSSVLIVV